MLTLGLNLRTPGTVPPVKPVPFALTSANMSRSYVPGGGLFCSALIHNIAVLAILFFPMFRSFTQMPAPPTVADLIRRHEVVYLPILRSGGPGTALPGGAPAAAAQKSSEDAAP